MNKIYKYSLNFILPVILLRYTYKLSQTGSNVVIYFLCAPSSGHTDVQRNEDIVKTNKQTKKPPKTKNQERISFQRERKSG